MCDCPDLRCEQDGCTRRLPVHIADFCVPRDTVHVRCERHPPAEADGWMAFDGCDEEDGTPPYTMYLRCTATEDEFAAANTRNDALIRRIGLGADWPATHYGVGADGGICPNLGGDYTERLLTLPYDGKGEPR